MIGLIDVDGHSGFPNLALMKISSYWKSQGQAVEWAMPMFGDYDVLYSSKVFTFSQEPEYNHYRYNVLEKGGTGYSIPKTLPKEMDVVHSPDYTIYPNCDYSIQFYSRGCIRQCPFCLVREKEGKIHPVEPMELNPKGKWVEVLDNNFFANPEWKSAVKELDRGGQPVKFHGVDVRIMDEEQAWWLNKLKLKTGIHIAWDLPQLDLTDRLKAMVKHISPYKITCYVLVGFNSTIEQDLNRIYTLRDLGITPFVQPYRDFENKRSPTQYEKDLARWVNQRVAFKLCDFENFSPRKGFKCGEYLKREEVVQRFGATSYS